MEFIKTLFEISNDLAQPIAALISWVIVISTQVLIFFVLALLMLQPLCLVIEKIKKHKSEAEL